MWKKSIWLILVIVTIFVLIGGAILIFDNVEVDEGFSNLQDGNLEDDGNGKIEEDIYKEIEKNGEASVIISLSDEGINLANVDMMKAQIKERQDKVLEVLGDGFRLIGRFEVVSGFYGIVNEKGLEILEKHELVDSVYLERILHTNA